MSRRKKQKEKKKQSVPVPVPQPPPSQVPYQVAAVCVLVNAFFLSIHPVQGNDIFLYLAIGRRIMEAGQLIGTDPFIHSIENYHWEVSHQWLAHLGAHLIHRVSGFSGLIVLKGILVTFAAALPLWVSRKKGGADFIFLLILLAALWAASSRYSLRTSLVGNTFALTTLAILLTRGGGEIGKARFVLPPLFLLWANIHPSFPVGLGFLVFFLFFNFRSWSRQQRVTWITCLVLCLVACLANPRGPWVLAFPLRSYMDPDWARMHAIYLEWKSPLDPEFRGHYPVWLAMGIIGATGLRLLVAAMKNLRQAWFPLAIFAVLTLLFFQAVRYITFSTLGCMVIWASLTKPGDWSWIRPGRFAAIVGLVALLLVGKVVFSGYKPHIQRQFRLGIDENMIPVKTADFIERENINGRIFNHHGFGAYFAYRWNGERKVFYHGAVEDPDLYLNEYMDLFTSSSGFHRVVAKYKIDLFILRNVERRLFSTASVYQYLFDSPDWELKYHDSLSLVFQKRTE